MPSTPAPPSAPLHIIDVAGDPDPLAALVIGPSDAIDARRLRHPVLRLRMALDLRRRMPAAVVAWGEEAYTVAVTAGARGIYRPRADDDPSAPAIGWRAVAASSASRQRLADAGWSLDDCWVVPPPGVDGRQRRHADDTARRRALGFEEDDYIWLLAGDASPAAGLREAIWAGTVLHVLERGIHRHRLLLWGDALAQQRARRFVNQLGVPELCIATSRHSFHAVAALADAAVLLPQRAGATWSAAVVAQAGLPAVVNAEPDVQEVLGGRANVRTVPSGETRKVVREMLGLWQAGPGRLPPDPRYQPAEVLRQWRTVLAASLSTGSGPGT